MRVQDVELTVSPVAYGVRKHLITSPDARRSSLLPAIPDWCSVP